MAIFTALATFILSGTFLAGSAIATSLLASAIGVAVGIGLNYVAKALAGNEEANKENVGGTQGTLVAGGDVPRAFGVGYHVTAGSLVYANTWGVLVGTPNAFLTQVIALSDMPGEKLLELWVNGEKVTITSPFPPSASGDTGTGVGIPEYFYGTNYHLMLKYYDGTQTAADGFLQTSVSSAERPWGSNRIGKGVCYVVITAMVTIQDDANDPALWTGFPTFKFGLSGIPLYDPSKDSTVGGSGSHIYSNPATWGGDGDQLPAVQAYNILRGIRYNTKWLYGLQNLGAARLPPANWIAQINKCRATITGESGLEPTYRSGGQINVDAQPASAIDAILTACQGRLSEIGGFYKIYVGEPDSSVMGFTDADLLSSEEQTFRPFFSLSDSVNGIQGTYPDPAQGWETATAPPLYRTDLEVLDGNRRLMAAPQFNFVPYRAQVQRLQKSGIAEAQRARTHVIPLPPAYWALEPGDVVTWNSVRNGYIDKLFRVDSVVDRANLDLQLAITEIDPSDYDWTHATDFTGVVTGPTAIIRPPPQGVLDWFAEGIALYDRDGISKRPAIRIAWDPDVQDVVGIQYEVRLADDLSHVTRGRSDQLQVGALIISQGLIPLEDYEVRGQYLPGSPRAMLWSDWLPVTTPSVVTEDIPAEIVVQVTNVMDYLNDRLAEVEQRFATAQSKLAAQDYETFRNVRTQFTAQHGVAMAEIATVETVAAGASEAVAELETSVTAQFGATNASVVTNATAIANIEGWGAAQYSVTLDVNNYAVGFELVNGGPGTSETTFVTDKFLIASPGVGGGAPVPIFAVANVGGAPKVAIRGDVYADGTIAATKIIAGSITAAQIATGTITSASGVIGALSVKTLSIGDNAITVPVAQSFSFSIGATATTLASFNVVIDTTGIAGKIIGLYVLGTVVNNGSGASTGLTAGLWIDGNLVTSLTVSSVASPVIPLSYKVDVTASGGVMSVPVELRAFWTAGAAVVSGTLFAIACKR